MSPEVSILSVIIPARDESQNLIECINEIATALNRNDIKHEILVIDDGSTDDSITVLEHIMLNHPTVRFIENKCENGFGRAVRLGLDNYKGDAVAIMMADRSDSPSDLVTYWEEVKKGYECIFGSRFMTGSKIYHYPKFKLIINRIVNIMIKVFFHVDLNDTTNAFKMYRREVIDGCKPFIAPHFNLTVEIPLKAIIRGYSWKIIPISWKNRNKGIAKLKLREMGSRYFFIIAYLWLEKFFSKGDYKRK